MSREAHVRFCERRGVRLPPATLLVVMVCGTRDQAAGLVDEVGAVLDTVGLQLALDKTGPLARPNDAIPGFGRPSAQRSRAHSLSMNRVSSDFFFDYTSCLA